MPPTPQPPPPPARTPRDRVAALFASAVRDVVPAGADEIAAADHVRADRRVAAAEELHRRVLAGLARWVGPYGAHALVTRALVHAQADHPALSDVTLPTLGAAGGTPPARLAGVAESAGIHGAPATLDALGAMLTSLAELIGRLVGDDLAMTILEGSLTDGGAPPHRAITSNDPATPPSGSTASPTASDRRTPAAESPDVPATGTEP